VTCTEVNGGAGENVVDAHGVATNSQGRTSGPNRSQAADEGSTLGRKLARASDEHARGRRSGHVFFLSLVLFYHETVVKSIKIR
jgi:hypothetical protein